MLSIEHSWGGLQFEGIAGCGPGSWEEALALRSLSHDPDVAFVAERLCILTSFHFMQTPDPDWDCQWDVPCNFPVQRCFIVLKTVHILFQNSKWIVKI